VGKTWLVKAKENVTLASRCRQVVMGKVEFEKEQMPAKSDLNKPPRRRKN